MAYARWFYADDLVLMAEPEELLLEKLRKWRNRMEARVSE